MPYETHHFIRIPRWYLTCLEVALCLLAASLGVTLGLLLVWRQP